MLLDWLVLAVTGLLNVHTAAYVASLASLAKLHMSSDIGSEDWSVYHVNILVLYDCVYGYRNVV